MNLLQMYRCWRAARIFESLPQADFDKAATFTPEYRKYLDALEAAATTGIAIPRRFKGAKFVTVPFAPLAMTPEEIGDMMKRMDEFQPAGDQGELHTHISRLQLVPPNNHGTCAWCGRPGEWTPIGGAPPSLARGQWLCPTHAVKVARMQLEDGVQLAGKWGDTIKPK